RDPVRVPALAPVERERLLPGGRPLGDGLPGEADPDLHALDDVVALEHADAVPEAADAGRVELAVAHRRGPPDPPGPGAGVEQPQREPLEAGPAREARRLVRVDVPEAAEDRHDLRARVELDPARVVAHQQVGALAVLLLPTGVEAVPCVV